MGKLPESGCEEDDIKTHFAQFGSIAEVCQIEFVFDQDMFTGDSTDRQKQEQRTKELLFRHFRERKVVLMNRTEYYVNLSRVAKKLIDEGQCVINGHKMMIKQVRSS